MLYVYDKQLEEADIIVINKTDLLDPEQLEHLRSALSRSTRKRKSWRCRRAPEKAADTWHATMLAGDMDLREAPEVDYEVYAEGEALLGWLNAAARLSSKRCIDGNALLRRIADDIQSRLATNGGRDRAPEDDAFARRRERPWCLNLVRGDGKPESIHRSRTTSRPANC